MNSALVQEYQRLFRADNKETMAGTKAGGVQSRPLFAGLYAALKAIRPRSPASTVHVALPSRHRGWRDTRVSNHQYPCATPKTLQLHPIVKGSRTPHCSCLLLTLLTRDLLADLSPARVVIVAVRAFVSTGGPHLLIHLRPAYLGLHLRQIRDPHCLACAPEAILEQQLGEP